jgi:hypothetical protein
MANFCGSQKPAVELAQRRIISLSPRPRQGDVDWRCAVGQLKAMRAAYHAILAHAHASPDLGGGHAIAPKGSKLLVTLSIPG